MDEKFNVLIDNTREQFAMADVEVTGVSVCDTNGLPLASKNVSISPGPLARLAELASSLSDRSIVVCLEHNEAQVFVHQTDKTVVAIYTKSAI